MRAARGAGMQQRSRARHLLQLVLLPAFLVLAACGSDDGPSTCGQEPPTCGSACRGDAFCEPDDPCAFFRANKPVEWRCTDGKWVCIADPILPCR